MLGCGGPRAAARPPLHGARAWAGSGHLRPLPAFFFLAAASRIGRNYNLFDTKYVIATRVLVKSYIFNCVCEIINDHRAAGTRRVPCRNTRSVTHAAATRLDHTRLKRKFSLWRAPTHARAASLRAHTVRVPGPLLSVRDDMLWPLLWYALVLIPQRQARPGLDLTPCVP
jgi:hypothetical protein